MAAAGREGQDVHVHVEAFVHGQQIAHEHVFHVVVDAFFDVVGIAEHGVGLHRGIGMRDVALLVEQEAQGLVRPVTEGDAHPGGRVGIAALRHDFGASAYSDGQRAFTVKHVDKGFDLAGRAVGHGGPAAGRAVPMCWTKPAPILGVHRMVIRQPSMPGITLNTRPSGGMIAYMPGFTTALELNRSLGYPILFSFRGRARGSPRPARLRRPAPSRGPVPFRTRRGIGVCSWFPDVPSTVYCLPGQGIPSGRPPLTFHWTDGLTKNSNSPLYKICQSSFDIFSVTSS